MTYLNQENQHTCYGYWNCKSTVPFDRQSNQGSILSTSQETCTQRLPRYYKKYEDRKSPVKQKPRDWVLESWNDNSKSIPQSMGHQDGQRRPASKAVEFVMPGLTRKDVQRSEP